MVIALVKEREHIMKKLFCLFVSLALGVIILSGCGSSSSSSDDISSVLEAAPFDTTAVSAETVTIGGTSVSRSIITNKVIVTLASGKTESDLSGSLPEGYSVVGRNTELGVYEVGVPSDKTIASAISEIGALSTVSQAGHDIVISTFLTPDDETFTSGVVTDPWPYVNSNSKWAWDLTTGATDVLIAIIDSGITIDHTEFTGRIISGHDYYQKDAVPEDEDGHGTAVAGMAVATGNNLFKMAGMNWVSSILAIRACSDGAGSANASIDGVTEAIKYYASSYDMVIINTSMGVELDPSIAEDAVLINAFKAAAQKCADATNCLWIAPAGNENKDATYVYPAALSQVSTYPVISVGGHNRSDTRWSGTYNVGDKASNYGDSINISAAADEIYSLQLKDGATTGLWGTSLSSPLIAGAASLVRAYFDSLGISVSPSGVKNMLIDGGETITTDKNIGPKLDLRGAILNGLGLHSKGVLSISCNVEGATISVDSTDTGKTTASSGNYARLAASAGSRAVTISKSGYSTYSGTVTVTSGAEETVDATLTASGSSSTQYTYGPYAYSATPVTDSLIIPSGATVYIGNASSVEGEKTGFFSPGYAGWLKINDDMKIYDWTCSSCSGSGEWVTYYFSSTSDYYYGSTDYISPGHYSKYKSGSSLTTDTKWVNITNLVNLGQTNTFTFYHYTENPKGYIIRIDQ